MSKAVKQCCETLRLTLSRPGGRKVPALTFNVYNFVKIQPNAAKLYEFF